MKYWYFDTNYHTPDSAAAELEWAMMEFGEDVEYNINDDTALAITDAPKGFLDFLVRECGGHYE